MSRTYVGNERQRPLFGKPFIRGGQLLMIGAYLFQLGGILGRAFRERPVPFASVYAAEPGGGEKLASWLQGDAARTVAHYGDRVDTINDFVFAYEMDRTRFSGDFTEYFLRQGVEKIDPEAALELATIYGAFGAGFGMVHPDMFVAWYERNYEKKDPETWGLMHKAGLAIPANQEDAPYDQAERDAVAMFHDYTLEFFPELSHALGFD